MFHIEVFLKDGFCSCRSYPSESEHLVWSMLEDDSDLSQVGGALPEQTLLRAAGWNKERQLSSKLLRPVLHLVRWRIRGVESHTHRAACLQAPLSADVL